MAFYWITELGLLFGGWKFKSHSQAETFNGKPRLIVFWNQSTETTFLPISALQQLCTSAGWQKLSDCASIVLLFSLQARIHKRMLYKWTPILCLSWLPLIYEKHSSHTSTYNLSRDIIRMKCFFCCIPFQPVTAVTLRQGFLKVLWLFMEFHLHAVKHFIHWASVNEKKKWIIGLKLSFGKL